MGESLCFVFPWADGGNLRELWSEADRIGAPTILRDLGLVMWALEQMYGLADALSALYMANGRHGDLKPENILRFTEAQGRGVLQIADVGLAKIHTQATRHRNAQTATMTGTFRYEPPECDEPEPQRARSRDYDVWSLGCIYLEFIIWLVDGRAGLEKFNLPGRFRNFWDYKDGNYVVHAAVQESMESVSQRLGRSNGNSDSALKAVLELVKTRLLQTNLAAHGLEKEHSRANAVELIECMRTIYERAISEPAYLFDESIWWQSDSFNSRPCRMEPQITRHPEIPVISIEFATNPSRDHRNTLTMPPTMEDGPVSTPNLPLSTMVAREQEVSPLVPEIAMRC